MGADPTDRSIEAALRRAPVEGWAKLWGAVDELEKEREHYAWAGGEQVDTTTIDGVEQPVFHMDYVVYSDTVNQIVGLLYELRLVIPFGWRSWNGVERYGQGRDLDTAPVAEAVRLLTATVRADRFSEGTIAAMIDDGTLQAALRRLRRWHDTDREVR